MATRAKWYILNAANEPTGPLSTADLATKVENEELKKDALCWCDGRDTWQCAEDIAEIQAALGALQPVARTEEKSESAALEKAAAEVAERQFVDDDGTLYVWNAELKKYVPKEKSYKMEEMTFDGSEEKIPSVEEALKCEAIQAETKRKEAPETNLHWSDPKKTTSVYVTGLPLDVTVEEVAVVFSKCGVLKEDDAGVRVKLYRDKASRMAKGDGLVTYLKRPSVDLAMQFLNGTPFRENMRQTMSVQEAKFEMKGEHKSKKRKNQKTKKTVREDKLLGWGGFDDHLPAHKITVVLSHMFCPDELEKGKISKEELKEDVQTECAKLGEVDRVVVYAENPDGIVSVRFRSEEAADACVQRMHGRFFSQRKIEAHKWDGFTKYHKATKEEVEVDEAARLEQFARDLERS